MTDDTQDTTDDATGELMRLRELVRELQAQIRNLESERDHWQVQALLA